MIPSLVADYLDHERVHYSVIPHRAAFTAQEEAAATHVPGHAWAKSVVCMADDQPLLAVVPAPCTVDLERLRQTVDADSLRLADESEFTSLYRDCEPGAMPPLGPLFGQRVVVDKRLTADPEIVFEGGSHQDAIRMPYSEFARVSQPIVAEFADGPTTKLPPRILMSIDPVCGMQIDEGESLLWSDHQGTRIYFCGRACKMEFDDNPAAYMGSRR